MFQLINGSLMLCCTYCAVWSYCCKML